jgi:hypothetical protein
MGMPLSKTKSVTVRAFDAGSGDENSGAAAEIFPSGYGAGSFSMAHGGTEQRKNAGTSSALRAAKSELIPRTHNDRRRNK